MWQAPPAAAPYPNEWLPTLDIPAPGAQNRLTVLFRLLLLIPQFIVLWVLSIVAFVVTSSAGSARSSSDGSRSSPPTTSARTCRTRPG